VFLGLDIGTSSVKAVLVDGEQRIVAQSSAPLAVSHPAPLWSEQNPDDWWLACEQAVSELRSRTDSRWSDIVGIGLSGQMHGAVLLGDDDRPLRPAILWNDGRAAAACLELERRLPELPQITGNRAMPGFTAPKLIWLAEHEPKTFAACRRVLLPKDYIRLVMTGDAASDMSDSAGTLWLDVGARRWSDEALAATGLTRSQMPALFEGTQVTGWVRSELAARWGLRNRVAVAAGAGDNAAGAVGMGVIADGAAMVSLGTSGVTFVASDRYSPNAALGVHTFCHALPNRWHQMAVHLSAAQCLAWLATILGAAEQVLLDELADVPVAPRGVFFLPYLSGERTPHNDPGAVATFHGLRSSTDRRDLVQAVLEGVAFAFRDGLDAIRRGGTGVERASLVGGGARSRYWAQIMADVLELPLDLRAGGEVGPAVGAARLARLGVTREESAVVCTQPALVDTLQPRAARSAEYRAAQHRFRESYQRLRPLGGDANRI
jgi:xylulokinase